MRGRLTERHRHRTILRHARGRRRPNDRAVIVPDKTATAEDVEIAARLLLAYKMAVAAAPTGTRSDVWSGIAEQQQEFGAILAADDAGRLAQYLCNVSRRDASIGITQGVFEFRRISRDVSYRNYLALLAKDRLVSLAEAVGAIAVENPEQGPYGANLYLAPGDVVDRASRCLGLSLAPPDIDGGLFKLDTGRGLFGERDATAIYTAWLLSKILADQKNARVCEIGGGSGRVAYWSHRMGLVCYTLIDLPRTNVVQGYYALKSLPPRSVVLYGEEPPPGETDCLKILPAHAISAISEPAYDLVLNQDSFPEINRDSVIEYLKWIRTTCTGQFLSINHESMPPYGGDGVQLSVRDAVADVGGFELKARWPDWMRHGYVGELYRVLA